MRISDWSSDVCSSDLACRLVQVRHQRVCVADVVEGVRAGLACLAALVGGVTLLEEPASGVDGATELVGVGGRSSALDLCRVVLVTEAALEGVLHLPGERARARTGHSGSVALRPRFALLRHGAEQ